VDSARLAREATARQVTEVQVQVHPAAVGGKACQRGKKGRGFAWWEVGVGGTYGDTAAAAAHSVLADRVVAVDVVVVAADTSSVAAVAATSATSAAAATSAAVAAVAAAAAAVAVDISLLILAEDIAAVAQVRLPDSASCHSAWHMDYTF